MSDNIIRKAKTLKSLKEKADFIFGYITDVNKKQGKFLRKLYDESDNETKKQIIKEYLDKGIYIHQPPFWDNVNFDELKALYKKYDFVKPYNCTMNGKPIKKPLIIADQYFLRLKHDPQSKLSARSTSFLNMKRVPSKSKTFKKKQELYSKTPIRLGEMETINLLLMKDPELVNQFLMKYSSSDEIRELFIHGIITGNALDLDKIDFEELRNRDDIVEHGVNNNKEILDVLLKSIGLELERG